MKSTPVSKEIVKQALKESGITEIGKASIREIKRLVDIIEANSGIQYIRMEMGIPGLPAVELGVEAEIAALKSGVASIYPDIQGINILKNEISKFAKNFLDINVSSESCIPTVGSMQGSFAAFLLLDKISTNKNKVLFIDPGFPVHKQQLRVLNQKFESFDVYNYRGDKLKEKLESYLIKGDIHSILYSNPNNPSWICFTEKELSIIGELATKYDVIVLEDLAYFGMDFRRDISVAGVAPFQPSVAKYCENYILFISSSKAFSYAGQRVGMMVVSDKLFNAEFTNLKDYYSSTIFGHAIVYGALYALSAGTSHSAQHALTSMLKAVNEGKYNFVDKTKEYGEKAKIMKRLFIENGFYIVYDKDEDDLIADGFYFTFAYPGMNGFELLENLIYYGISAITLGITGSERIEGLRACVSLVQRNQFQDLEERLKQFNIDYTTI